MDSGSDFRQARPGVEGLTKPDPLDHASQLIAWAICWPWNVVWTCLVYNPFRFIGEFLLKEIRSGLYEISNGQFSAIERDLSLDDYRDERSPAMSRRSVPSAAPVPAIEKPTETEQPAATTDAPVVESATEATDSKASPASPTPAADLQASASPVALERAAFDTATFSEGDSQDQNAEREVAAEHTEKVESTSAPDDSQRPLPAETSIERGLASQAPNEAYPTWVPPEPAGFAPLSDRPLRALRYSDGQAPPPGEVAPMSQMPKEDPWLTKRDVAK